MSKGNNTQERLSQVLQRGDPAGDRGSATPDPIRRDALLIRCAESLSQPAYVQEPMARQYIPPIIGTLALSATLLLLFFWATRPKELESVPQVAVLVPPMPTPSVSRKLPKTVGEGVEKPKTSPLAAKPNRGTKETHLKRLVVNKRKGKKRPFSLAIRKPTTSTPHLTAASRAKLETALQPESQPMSEPVVERVILIADATLPEPEPSAETVTISVSEQSHAVIVSRPRIDKTRR
jgi:hypothetical protein